MITRAINFLLIKSIILFICFFVSSSYILVRANSFNGTGADFDVSTTGNFTLEPYDNAFASTLTFPITGLTLLSNVSGLTLGKASNTSDVTIASKINIAGPITVYGSTIEINAALTATKDDINFHTSTTVSQTAAITANGLGLHGTGTFNLQNTSNNIATIAGGDDLHRLGSLAYRDADALEIGMVNVSGLFSNGTILVETEYGNLTMSNDINTLSTSESAIVLNAGHASIAGTATGVDIIVSGTPTLTYGFGGRAKLFSGLESRSTGLNTLVGGSENTLFNLDETSDLSGKGLIDDMAYAIYRSAANTAPSVTSTSITTATAESLYYYDIIASDVDNDIITWTESTVPSWLTFTSGMVQKSFIGTGVRPTNTGDGVNQSPDGTSATSAVINAGTAAHGNNKLFFTDKEEYGIRYVDANGNVQTWYQGNGSYLNLNPVGIAYDEVNDVVYVGDYAKGDILKIDNTGTRSLLSDLPESFMFRLLMNSDNSKLYASARGGIYEIDLTNTNAATNWTRVVGTGTYGYSDTGAASTSQVNQPHGMAFDSANRLVFTDRGNYIIRRVNLSADTIETIAGSQGVRLESGDGGSAVNASFDDPSGLVINKVDEIFISERISKRIRKIDASGTIDTFFRVASGGFADDLVISENSELYLLTSSLIAQVASKAELTGTPTNSDVGVHDVELILSDGIDDTPYNFKITVNTTPTVISKSATSISANGATLNGELSNDGNSTITERGFVYALSSDDATPSIAEVNGTTVFKATVTGTTGAYIYQLSNLSINNEYSYVAYATNSVGTTEGLVETFITNPDIDGDGILNESDADIDGDGTLDNGTDFDGDGVNDANDPDIDGDGLLNEDDPNDNNTDTDGDGTLDGNDVDVDGDGTLDNGTDFDGDGINDANDPDIDGDSVLNTYDAFPLDDKEWVDTDNDGTGNNADNDDDNDGQLDTHETTCGSDPLDASSKSLDQDGDGIPNCVDTDDDGDGVLDVNDEFPLDKKEWVDTDNDGTGNNADTDDDNDGQLDAHETTCGSGPLDASSKSLDTDGDGIPNCVDTDDDGDGVLDVNDAFPLDDAESVDTDGDGTGNNADTDDDNDGQLDIHETTCGSDPLDASSKSLDQDGDGIPNCVDTDDDGDGVLDVNDEFPLDKKEWVDTDNDGTGNNADTDDDNDGQLDTYETSCGSDPLDLSSKSLDTDSDGIPNCVDTDDDNDGVLDVNDDFPLDEDETVDTDGDSIGNNADTDDDGDGQSDADETSCGSDPLDKTKKSLDTDSDGIPNCVDTDDDGDGVLDVNDYFPLDEDETVDTDGDGIGNNADTDDDGDGQSDADETSCGSDPLDKTKKSLDTDSDGIPNCVDTDDDNDGVLDINDAFPVNPSESIDTDGDGIGNNADTDDDNDGLSDVDEASANTNPLKVDSDNDGVMDGTEVTDKTNPLNPCSLLVEHQTESTGMTYWDSLDCDNDGVPNGQEVSSTPVNSGSRTTVHYELDSDGDGILNYLDPDDDGDGVNTIDELMLNASTGVYTQIDTDGDSTPNYLDIDDDNDGIATVVETDIDTDEDGTPNYLDTDDDGDGIVTVLELSFSDIEDNTTYDSDGDGTPNYLDPVDNYDASIALITVDPNTFIYLDTDGDGIPNIQDTDDDNDGFLDSVELTCGTNPLRIESQPGDYDDDGIADCIDSDIDGDGVDNINDLFPMNPFESADNDGDGLGDNIDADDDNDGVIDAADAFPLNASESADVDSDGIGDNTDTDLYNDGFNDSLEGISGLLTPSTNGIESKWVIANINLHPYNIVNIYDKEGKIVFQAQNYKNDWDGTYKDSGIKVPSGSYYYKVHFYDTNQTFTGWLFISY